MSDLTLVAPGGVQRTDIATDTDIATVQATATEALQVASQTRTYLGTRVPAGRTVNGKALTNDVVISAEDIGAYDKTTVDQKISAVEAGGYNPVHVNGRLLDRDVILTPGDIGTYSATQIDAKVNGFVLNTITINGRQLTGNVTLTAADLNAYTSSQVDAKLQGYVPTTLTVNGKQLYQNIALTAADVGAYATADAVPRVYTINGNQMLGTGLTIAASDVGAYSKSEVDTKVGDLLSSNNPAGVGMTSIPYLTKGYIQVQTTESVLAAGFYGYKAGLDSSSNPTSVTDRPTGSAEGQFIAIPYGIGAKAATLAFPGDVAKLMYQRPSVDGTTVTPWIALYSTENKPSLTDLGAFADANIPVGNIGDSLFVSTVTKGMVTGQSVLSARIVNSDTSLATEKLTTTGGHIYDARNGNVWVYTSAWALSGATLFSELLIGRTYVNPRTKKQFYLSSATVITDISPAAPIATVATTGIRVEGDTGIIEQWGTLSATAAGEHIITLATPMPNAILNVQATLTYNGLPGYASAKVIDKTSIMIFFAGGTDGSYAGAAWRVIGN